MFIVVKSIYCNVIKLMRSQKDYINKSQLYYLPSYINYFINLIPSTKLKYFQSLSDFNSIIDNPVAIFETKMS